MFKLTARARTIQSRKRDFMERGVSVDKVPFAYLSPEGLGTVLGDRPQIEENNSGAISPNKTVGKLKKRGRPSLSNGQQFSDSEGEFPVQNNVPKPLRKISGRRLNNKHDLSVTPKGPNKMIPRKGKLNENRVKRSYTRRHTIPSVTASSHAELAFKTPPTLRTTQLNDSPSPPICDSLSPNDRMLSTPGSENLDFNRSADTQNHESQEDYEIEPVSAASKDLPIKRADASPDMSVNDVSNHSINSSSESRRKAPRKQVSRCISD